MGQPVPAAKARPAREQAVLVRAELVAQVAQVREPWELVQESEVRERELPASAAGWLEQLVQAQYRQA
jgi:hypothetical protein